MYNEKQYENKVDLEKKSEKTLEDLIERMETDIDWNLVSIFSIWIFLSFTFFCIFA